MNFKIEHRDAVKTAGYVFKTSMTEVSGENPIPEFWQSVFGDGRHKNLHSIQKRCGDYGICVMEGEDDMAYIIAVEIADDTEIPKDMAVCEIPAGEYVVIETPLSKISEAWAGSYEWVEANGYDMTGGISYEYYDDRINQDPQILDIVIPVVRKEE